MDTTQRIERVLREAERSLAILASTFAQGGDYGAASRALHYAFIIKGFLAEAAVSTAPGPGTTAGESAPSEDVPDGAKARFRRKTPIARGSAGTYPRFLREGDLLVKIGWSRKSQSEYEHKCSKRVIELLASALSALGGKGRQFTMERVLPLADQQDGSRIPDYQTYVCLAWLKSLRLVVQHGRKGYTLASKVPLEPLLEARWNELPLK